MDRMTDRFFFRLLLLMVNRTICVWRGPAGAIVLAGAVAVHMPLRVGLSMFAVMAASATLYCSERDDPWRRFAGHGHIMAHGLVWLAVAGLIRQSVAALQGAGGIWAVAAQHVPTALTQMMSASASVVVATVTLILMVYLAFAPLQVIAIFIDTVRKLGG